MNQPASFPQPNKLRNGHKGLCIFCSEDEQSRTCWLSAFRLFKVRPQEQHGGWPPAWDPQHKGGVIALPAGGLQKEGRHSALGSRVQGWSLSCGFSTLLVPGQTQP